MPLSSAKIALCGATSEMGSAAVHFHPVRMFRRFPSSPALRGVRRVRAIGALLVLAAVGLRADIAVMRAPSGGGVGANPGLLKAKVPEVGIELRSADVKIHLRRGEPLSPPFGRGSKLVAECQADFELVDRSQPGEKPRAFLVAFPITALGSEVEGGEFSVTVDGNKPALVRRKVEVVYLGYNRGHQYSPPKVVDEPLNGKFEARFKLPFFNPGTELKLADESSYEQAFVWPQQSQPGATTRVRVVYSATLTPLQLSGDGNANLSAGMSYGAQSISPEIGVALAKGPTPASDGRYYVFDYVLRSGSTWAGDIGRETITLTVAPDLQVPLARVRSLPRFPFGAKIPEEIVAEGTRSTTATELDGTLVWQVKGKPRYDLFMAIPAEVVAQAAATTKP